MYNFTNSYYDKKLDVLLKNVQEINVYYDKHSFLEFYIPEYVKINTKYNLHVGLLLLYRYCS